MKTNCNDYHREYLKRRYNERWPLAIALLGGKCRHCGATERLEFDHIDPKTKSFQISDRIAQLSWDKIQAELSKCQILCTVCHSEKHRNDKVLIHGEHGRIIGHLRAI
jgi:5-methylcytosine-specific restriction endonuclease McrA